MERLVLVHGSVTNGATTWNAQRPLAAWYELVVVERPGFPPGPTVERVDFEEHAVWVAERLEPGDHLVGHSYGGVIALLAAVLRPELRSLIAIEPPCFDVARGEPSVEAFVAEAIALRNEGPSESELFLRLFLRAVGSTFAPPSPLPPALEQGARTLLVERPPYEAKIPLARLRELPFPKLVVSGDHHPAFDAVCEVLERALDAERIVLRGAGHAVQRAPGFNERLLAFLEGASDPV
ncbi:MAG: alpha/beta hydrolase [Gaiellaceae bacterium MAG52_C11]|nr:alpha/beta hydrolase [Candidatus Gaiellasilicea maunaloa]